MTARPALSPEMLLFEVAAICSRHGIPVSTANPSASLHYAAQLMRSLGLVVPADPPAAIESAPAIPATPTAELPRVPLPPSFTRGQHRPGAPRVLRAVTGDGA